MIMVYNKVFKKNIFYINNKMSNKEDNDDTEDVQKKVTEEFADMVKKWAKIDDQIRENEKKNRELKKERKEYESFVLEFMETQDIKVIDITGGKLRRNKSNTKSGLTPSHIQSCLYEMTNDSAKALKITKTIMEKRPSVERVNLKRTFERGNK